MGRDLGGLGGRFPKLLRWGDGPCIRPPIFWEVLLLEVRQSTNWLKKGLKKEFFVQNNFCSELFEVLGQEKGHKGYISVFSQ